MNFDPNNQASGKKRKNRYDYLWSTYVPTRQPKFKIHGTRALAISAVRCRNHWQGRGDAYAIDERVKLYRRDTVDGLWVEVPIKYINDGKEIIDKSA